MGKIVLYIAMSVDGFIAREDGNIDWLTKYNSTGEDYGYKSLLNRVGTIIFGGKTYKLIEKEANKLYTDKKVYVFSRKTHKNNLINTHFVKGDVNKIITNIRSFEKKDIWLVGGADLVTQFINSDLIDEYIIAVVPIVLGRGIRLFESKKVEISLKLVDTKTFKSGFVLLTYNRKFNSKK